MSQIELESRLNLALDHPDPFESEKRIKETVADALHALDSSAALNVTRHFNHSYAPDMVLSWGTVHRPVYLRFTDDVPELAHDIQRLDPLDPLVFGLTTPGVQAVHDARLDEVSRETDTFFTTPAAVDALTSAERSTPTDRMLRNSLAQGGRGALVARDDAEALAKTVSDGFAAAAQGSVTPTRAALNAIGRHFLSTQTTRLTRVMQAVWERTSRADQFPGETEVTGRLNALSLAYLLEYMDTEDHGFWRGVGRGLDLDQVLALYEVAQLSNFQHLVKANLDVVRARACLVLDMALLDGVEATPFLWSVEPASRTAGLALALRGPAFQALVTAKKEHLNPRLGAKALAGIDIDTFSARAAATRLAAVDVTVGGMHVQVSAEGAQFDQGVLADATVQLRSPLVDATLVSTPTGRVTVDFTRMTGTARTNADPLMADLLTASVTLLADLEPEERVSVINFLDHAPEVNLAGEETLTFDDAEAEDLE